MRCSLHSIALKNILYINVGKKTHTLVLAKGVPDNMRLSLLMQNGSLDLQANSKLLGWDTLVLSCFSMILDDIHEEDWGALYEVSPELGQFLDRLFEWGPQPAGNGQQAGL